MILLWPINCIISNAVFMNSDRALNIVTIVIFNFECNTVTHRKTVSLFKSFHTLRKLRLNHCTSLMIFPIQNWKCLNLTSPKLSHDLLKKRKNQAPSSYKRKLGDLVKPLAFWCYFIVNRKKQEKFWGHRIDHHFIFPIASKEIKINFFFQIKTF